MQWNWQLADWPDFRFDPEKLRLREEQFLKGCGILIGSLGHVDGTERDGLSIELITQEVVESSAIEGEVLNRASVQSSLARQLGFAADRRRVNAAEAGAAEMMANLYRSHSQPLTEFTLSSWHAMLMNGRRDLTDIGGYRTQGDPMQIVSGPLHAPRVHFEAPPAGRVSTEMKALLTWFNETEPGAAKSVPAVTRAGIAHLWFESIHPFEDGNGRIGRAISEKALAQVSEGPPLTLLSATIHRQRKAYYQALQAAHSSNEIDHWLDWFADIVIEAQQRTLEHVRFLISKTKLFDRLRGQLNARQEKALLRMFREGPDGFLGGLSAANYRTITDATLATTTRDLVDLVAKRALVRTGERRHARYFLAV
jgi:Fic family protein